MKLAFVTPWYGKDIPGGAEAAARETTIRLRQAGFEVEVWTSCVRDLYSDWGKNTHRPGLHTLDGVPVRRFPVRSRDKLAFDRINARLMNGQSITPGDEQVFIEQMLRVDGLYEHIAQCADETLLFFIPYMFATTYYGAQVRPDRSYLIPCFHDEAYARLNIYRRAFQHVKGMLFLSEAERYLAESLFDLSDMYTDVVGVGVDLHHTWNVDDFRRKFEIDAPFVLYVGRREQGKNIGLLVDYFRRYRAEVRPNAQLVLIGPGQLPTTASAGGGILDLGYVSVQDKWNAYAAASVLCQPSTHESFSIVLMESWVTGRPALVHASSAVTVDHCRRANGGLYFSDYDEFATTLDVLLSRPDLRARLGGHGRDYVTRNFGWDTIVAKYRRLVAAEESA